MPLYEYLCPTCHRIYTFMAATTTDLRRPKCPRCGNVEMIKQLSLFAFVRGGTDPLAAIPKTETPEAAGDAPEHDGGLYFLWQSSA
jgi:putative FmdB family regulatory protein